MDGCTATGDVLESERLWLRRESYKHRVILNFIIAAPAQAMHDAPGIRGRVDADAYAFSQSSQRLHRAYLLGMPDLLIDRVFES